MGAKRYMKIKEPLFMQHKNTQRFILSCSFIFAL